MAMRMYTITTLTMNPALDLSYEVERVVDTHKMRAGGERADPGGGGINVARVFVRLGGNARCLYPSGGPVGVAFDSLLDEHQLVRTRIPIAGHTRASATVRETSTGREYRVVPKGPELSAAEWQACLEQVGALNCDYFVASGSLPTGVPDDFYAQIARKLAGSGVKFVLDSSGKALAEGLNRGGVFLVKPSQGELRSLAGRTLDSLADTTNAARDIVRKGQAEHVAVTLGHRGALLVNAEGTLFVPAIPIVARSAVGAGDSFLAAMVFRLCAGATPEEAFRYGVAAGAAAVRTPGTELCRPEDIEELYRSARDGHGIAQA
jgi:6-phosphofructokinase 2